MNSKIRQHYYGLDIVKLIAAVFVIASHTHPLTGYEGSLFYSVYSFFLNMAVPFFALASGFLLSKKLLWISSAEEDIQILKKTLITLVRLYLVWNLIQFPIAMQEPIPEGKPLYMIIARYLINFFFVGEHYLAWHLWYLLAYIYGVILLLALRKLNCKPWILGLAALAVFFFSCWLYWFISTVDSFTGTMYTLSVICGEVFLDGRLFAGISYILAGSFLGRLKRTPGQIPSLILLLLGFFLNIFAVSLPGFFLAHLQNPSCAIFLFLLCLQWKGTQSRPFCNTCRSVSTTFYFTHMFWFYIGYVLLDPIPSFTYWGAPAFFWCLLCSSITAIFVIRFQDRNIIKWLF